MTLAGSIFNSISLEDMGFAQVLLDLLEKLGQPHKLQHNNKLFWGDLPLLKAWEWGPPSNVCGFFKSIKRYMDKDKPEKFNIKHFNKYGGFIILSHIFRGTHTISYIIVKDDENVLMFASGNNMRKLDAFLYKNSKEFIDTLNNALGGLSFDVYEFFFMKPLKDVAKEIES